MYNDKMYLYLSCAYQQSTTWEGMFAIGYDDSTAWRPIQGVTGISLTTWNVSRLVYLAGYEDDMKLTDVERTCFTR
jgi:hypothetical protein